MDKAGKVCQDTDVTIMRNNLMDVPNYKHGKTCVTSDSFRTDTSNQNLPISWKTIVNLLHFLMNQKLNIQTQHMIKMSSINKYKHDSHNHSMFNVSLEYFSSHTRIRKNSKDKISSDLKTQSKYKLHTGVHTLKGWHY